MVLNIVMLCTHNRKIGTPEGSPASRRYKIRGELMTSRIRSVRLEDDIYNALKKMSERPYTPSWHIQEALRQYLAGKAPKVATKKPKAAKKDAVDYSVFGMSEDHISELIRIRRKNKGGTITQRVANALSKEFHKACSLGFTFDQLLTEWEVRGWKSFKAEWMKPSQSFGGGASSFDQTIESIKDVELPDMRNI